MTVGVSYDVPPQNDAIPQTRSIRPMLSDLILDFDNVYGLTIDNNTDDGKSMGATLAELCLTTIAIPSHTVLLYMTL
jgi:hypothetical protein